MEDESLAPETSRLENLSELNTNRKRSAAAGSISPYSLVEKGKKNFLNNWSLGSRRRRREISTDMRNRRKLSVGGLYYYFLFLPFQRHEINEASRFVQIKPSL